MADIPISPPASGAWATLLVRRWAAPIAAATGLVISLIDIGALVVVGVEMRLGEADGTWLVLLLFAATYSFLGFVIGRLLEARFALGQQQRIIQISEQTIRRQLQALEASQATALEAERLATIGQLAAGVAHEVRNPLAVIRAGASMLRADQDPQGDGYRAAQFIIEEVDRLNTFVTTMLSVARPVSDGRRGPLDPADPIERAQSLAQDTLRGKGISLEADLRVHPQILGDSDLLTQLILCLLTNAGNSLGAEGAIEGDGRITLSCAAAGERLNIDIADNGPGIPPEDLERVFEPFFTTHEGGTGLGLVMARRIAHWHGGSLVALAGHGCGAGGKGACFRLSLPLAPDPPSAPMPIPPDPPAAGALL